MKARLYTKDNCPFCTNAKTLFKNKGIEYTEIKIGKDITREEFLEVLPDAKTVPQIYLTVSGSEFLVGGFTDLVSYFKANPDAGSGN